DRAPRAGDARRLARTLARRAGEATASAVPSPLVGEGKGGGAARGVPPPPALPRRGGGGELPGAWLARAYPDRIARARGRRGEFLMANGRAAAVEPHDGLAGETYLAIGEVAGRAAAARILLAAPLTAEEVEALGAGVIETADELSFEPGATALRMRRRRRLGA